MGLPSLKLHSVLFLVLCIYLNLQSITCEKHFTISFPKRTTRPYWCIEPKKGLSSPVVTIFATQSGFSQTAAKFLSENRMHYAIQHGYRYCEQNMRADPKRIFAFSRIPFMFALMPCSDYVLHLDGDTIIANARVALKPWIDFMDKNKLELLLSSDCIVQSPLNFGVYMAKSDSWTIEFFRRLYNICGCDWSRTHDWPAEQGLVYDMLATPTRLNVVNGSRPARIISDTGWNRPWWGTKGKIGRKDFIVHYMNFMPHDIPQDEKSKEACRTSHECRSEGIIRRFKEALALGDATAAPVPHSSDFTNTTNTCKPIVFTELMTAQTYANMNERYESSVLDVQLSRDGKLQEVVLSGIACLGYRDKKCSLEKLWNMKTGKGPWMPEKDVINYLNTH